MATHRSHSLRAQLILIAIAAASLAWGHAESVHDAKLFELTKFQRFELSSLKGKKFLLVFFQVDCPPCREQLKALQCLKEKSPAVEIVAAGVGDPKELSKEVRRLKLTFPSVESTPSFQEKLDGINSTPVTFFIDEKGFPAKRETGTRSCEAWRKALGS